MRARIAVGLGLGTLGVVGSFLACRGPAADAASVPEPSARSPLRWEARREGAVARASADASLVAGGGGVGEAMECAPFAALDGARAVAGALLLLSELNEVEDTPVRTVEARAGPDGQATLCRRAGHTAMVDAWDDEGRWGRRSWWGPIRPGEPIPIYLAEPSTLSGRVVDAGGAPLAGASIELWLFPRGDEPATQRLSNQRSLASGADGAFAVDLPYAQMVAVTASAPGFVEALVEPVIVDGMVAPIELVLREESLVTGIVRLRGAPVEGARIMAPHTTLWTDASGRFELHGVARGEEVELGIAADGALRTLVRTVGEGDHVFDLPPATELVVIASLPPSMSECAAGTYIEVQIHPGGPSEVASDDDAIESGAEPGEAVVYHLEPGRYWVSAWAAGSEAQTEVRLAEGERVRLDLDLEVPRDRGLVSVRAPEWGEITIAGPEGVEHYSTTPSEAMCVALAPGEVRVAAGYTEDEHDGQPLTVRPGGRYALTLDPPPPRARPRVLRLDEIEAEPRRRCMTPFTLGDGEPPWVTFALPGVPVRPGDRVLSIDGVDDPWQALVADDERSARVVVERHGQQLTFDVPRTHCGWE